MITCWLFGNKPLSGLTAKRQDKYHHKSFFRLSQPRSKMKIEANLNNP